MALITAAQFREHYPRLTGTGEDVVLASLIARADDLMAAYCGFPEYDGGGGAHSLEEQTYTLYLDAPSSREPRALCLCVHPLTTVTSVDLDSTGAYLGDETTLTEDVDFAVNERDGILIRIGSTWPVAFQGTRVVVEAGYASTPPGLVAIAVAAVRHLWDLRNVQGMEVATFGGQSATFADALTLLPQAVQDALLPYRSCHLPLPAAA